LCKKDGDATDFWTDQRINGDEVLRSLTSSFGGSFWGRRGVGVMPDRGHHGEGEHDERDVTMPAVPERVSLWSSPSSF